MFILVAGCFLVLRPFLVATMLSAVVCISTWPLYLRLLHSMKNRQNMAALSMTLSLVLVLILPLALVAYNLTDNITAFYTLVKQAVAAGPVAPPAWLKSLPIFGDSLSAYWHLITTSREEMDALAQRSLEPARHYLLTGGMLLGQGVMELSLATFISFFIYRNGEELVLFFGKAMARIVGIRSTDILGTINNTVRGVMYGLLGTALAQGFVATVGFAIAGIPAPLLLGAATAILSLLPIGPPLIWGCVAIWLLYQGSLGWGTFILLWGFFLISGVDNVVKPMLISRGSNLPFILVLFGVMGGLIAFGFVGLFIGPTLLAVGFNLMREWESQESGG